MFLSVYFIDFVVFSFIGWIYECTYCTCKTKHWQNRGFLFGPVCPIYGSGAVAAMMVFGLLPQFSAENTPIWEVFLVCAAGSAVLEFGTSWILEKLFHAVWWDYSGMPLNVQGRICLPATLGFGVAGVLIVRFLLPFMRGLHQDAHPIANEAAALILMAVISADLALTVASLTRLLARMEAIQHDFNEHMEEGYQIAQAEGPVAATEYAAMTVKSAGSRAAALLTEQLQKRTGHLTGGELYHLHVIRHFKKYERKALALRIREKLAGKRVHAAEMRTVKDDGPKDVGPKDDGLKSGAVDSQKNGTDAGGEA